MVVNFAYFKVFLYYPILLRFFGSICSIGSIGSIGCIGSIGSIDCIGSIGSLGCIGSIGSIGCIGSIGSLGSIGCIVSIGSIPSTGLQLVSQYPFVAKALRDINKPHEERKHCCGMTLQTEGIGYKDLDELFTKPCDLEFIIEVVSIERPEEYERETWQLSEDERRAAVQKYRELGNEFYRSKQFAEAEAKYEAALGIVEQLLTK